MAFGLYSLLEAALLVLNAMCVLHEERFLAKVRAGRIISDVAAAQWKPSSQLQCAGPEMQQQHCKILHYTLHSYTLTHTHIHSHTPYTHRPKQELDIQLRNRKIKLFCGLSFL